MCECMYVCMYVCICVCGFLKTAGSPSHHGFQYQNCQMIWIIWSTTITLETSMCLCVETAISCRKQGAIPIIIGGWPTKRPMMRAVNVPAGSSWV